MPVYTWTTEAGESGSIYAANIFDAEDEVYIETGDHPETLKEVV